MTKKTSHSVITCISLLLIFYPIGLSAQDLSSMNFRPPLNIPLVLAGNFGEIRSDHFHSGLDFKTNRQAGLPVYATARGFISRIKVEPDGYGHALYIQHPNGYTSLYGHLSKFTKDIADYVKAAQYSKESFSVDLYPRPGQFTVKQGDFIAFSGSTGSSQAPHLHFELRENQTQHPVNPMLYPFKIADTKAPVILAVYLYSLTGRKDLKEPLRIPLYGGNGRYHPAQKKIYPLDYTAGVGIETIDYLDDSNNKCGIFELDVLLDDQKIFSSKMDEFSFGESLYVNSLIDYRIYTLEGKQVLKSFIEPNNHLSIYEYAYNRGNIRIRDTLVHKITIRVKDTYYNTSTTDILVRIDPAGYKEYSLNLPYYSAFFSYSEPNHFEDRGIKLDFRANSFYDNIYFSYHTDSVSSSPFSRSHHIHKRTVPLQRSYKLAIKPDSLPDEFRDHALIARVDASGSFSAIGGKWEGDYLTTRTRSFGSYVVTIDTIPPTIRYQGNDSKKIIRVKKNITFTITDNLSGIASFRGTIDGRWVLFEWDPKKATLNYQLDPERIGGNAEHKLSLVVKDNTGNKTVYTRIIRST